MRRARKQKLSPQPWLRRAAVCSIAAILLRSAA